MKKFTIKADNLTDWKSFHREFKNILGFPDYYGENMNAWIDCVDELTEDEQAVIHIENGKSMRETVPEILDAFLECSAFVNYRKIEAGENPSLLVSLGF
ncbi:barstar family protein [Pontibacter mangrovi]|uniref:Barnase inhibitor n=1 Tax=Pontibacter mangrovi TaxID=2589816 RepID=A0A501W254_9BACT|nr:barstar family protein [Pontibacter mangrovi]TPE42832.1 barnase inhibitor [Pontibacter mangrovi]